MRDIPEDDPYYGVAYPMSEHNSWPRASPGEDSALYEKFEKIMTQYYSMLFDVSLDLMQLLAIGLGLDEHYFDYLFTPKSLSTLRLINYPVHEAGAQKSDKDGMVVSTEQHQDTTVLTLLTTFDYEGLQVSALLSGRKKKNDVTLTLSPRLNCKMAGWMWNPRRTSWLSILDSPSPK